MDGQLQSLLVIKWNDPPTLYGFPNKEITFPSTNQISKEQRDLISFKRQILVQIILNESSSISVLDVEWLIVLFD